MYVEDRLEFSTHISYDKKVMTCNEVNLHEEHIVCSNIMSHLDEHKLLSDRQNMHSGNPIAVKLS